MSNLILRVCTQETRNATGWQRQRKTGTQYAPKEAHASVVFTSAADSRRVSTLPISRLAIEVARLLGKVILT